MEEVYGVKYSDAENALKAPQGFAWHMAVGSGASIPHAQNSPRALRTIVPYMQQKKQMCELLAVTLRSC